MDLLRDGDSSPYDLMYVPSFETGQEWACSLLCPQTEASAQDHSRAMSVTPEFLSLLSSPAISLSNAKCEKLMLAHLLTEKVRAKEDD